MKASHSRRHLLKMLASAPLMPMTSGLATLGASASLSACGGSDSAAVPTAVRFNSMAAPANVADRASTFTNATLAVSYSDGGTQTPSLSYKTLYKTGDTLTTPGGDSIIAGGYFDASGKAIVDNGVQLYSDCPDGQSLIQLDNSQTLFLVTQFEYKSEDSSGNSLYGLLPSPVGIATLDQNANTGELTVKHYTNVPTASVHGLWITCAGSMSPWNTHLSSEEYEPDAWTIASNTRFQAFSTYTFGDANTAKPYHYGHVPEVTVNADGTGSIKKHYCMGRISREKVKVMPDQRTVLQGDDATSGGIFMFIADQAGDLSSGTLYAAKLSNGELPAGAATAGGAFDFTWIKLGQATSAEIEALAGSLTAADIIDVQTTDPSDSSYTLINYGSGTQWVKVKTGMEKAAAFLETRRYAAIMGATMELTKFEGVTLDEANKTAYMAMSAIKSTMSDAAGDIQLNKLNAGATYAVTLGSDATIGSDWVAKRMAVPQALLGEDISADSEGNTANVDKIANPDNLSFSQSMGTLFIGEDSGMHLNNTVWAYNVASKSLSRVLTVPAGAECTGLQVKDNVNGFAYVLSNFQHPGDWGFNDAQTELAAAVTNNWGELKVAKAAVGYISGIPCLS
jgi:secreted PhoX family phosphatase